MPYRLKPGFRRKTENFVQCAPRRKKVNDVIVVHKISLLEAKLCNYIIKTMKKWPFMGLKSHFFMIFMCSLPRSVLKID